MKVSEYGSSIGHENVIWDNFQLLSLPLLWPIPCHAECGPSTLKYRPFHFSEELTKLTFLVTHL